MNTTNVKSLIQDDLILRFKLNFKMRFDIATNDYVLNSKELLNMAGLADIDKNNAIWATYGGVPLSDKGRKLKTFKTCKTDIKKMLKILVKKMKDDGRTEFRFSQTTLVQFMGPLTDCIFSSMNLTELHAIPETVLVRQDRLPIHMKSDSGEIPIDRLFIHKLLSQDIDLVDIVEDRDQMTRELEYQIALLTGDSEKILYIFSDVTPVRQKKLIKLVDNFDYGRYTNVVDLPLGTYDKTGLSPLLWACKDSNQNLAISILDSGNFTLGDVDNGMIGATAFGFACMNGKANLALKILDKYDETSVGYNSVTKTMSVKRDTDGSSYETMYNKLFGEFLTDEVSNINKLGNNALSECASNHHMKVIALRLLETDRSGKRRYVTDVDHKNISGFTPLMSACANSPQIALRLLTLKNDGSNVFNINTGATTNLGDTALVLACTRFERRRYGNTVNLVKTLLLKNETFIYDTNPAHVTNNGTTALLNSIHYKLEITRILLKLNSDKTGLLYNVLPSHTDVHGNNAFMLLCMNKIQGATAASMLQLTPHGDRIIDFDVNHVNNQGKSAIIMAIENSKTQVLEILLSQTDDKRMIYGTDIYVNNTDGSNIIESIENMMEDGREKQKLITTVQEIKEFDTELMQNIRTKTNANIKRGLDKYGATGETRKQLNTLKVELDGIPMRISFETRNRLEEIFERVIVLKNQAKAER